MKERFHLICNAHLDPVWMWEWEEGAAETLSTFRTAATLCEQHAAFVFNHNEAILYEWVQTYEPALFARIQRLVRQGRWYIMGGWYLQPDCTMPSGESLIRQIMLGRAFFQEHFGVRPRTAINFDPFGHSRGMVQILAKCGFDAYLFGRPTPDALALPAEAFTWRGFDGSCVIARRFPGWYNTNLGQARRVVEERIAACRAKGEAVAPILWGVGNHGGGPSRKDLDDIEQLIATRTDVEILHSTPDAYFADVRRRTTLPAHAEDITPWGVGCYTSQVRVKQQHRRLENELFMTEKMATAATFQGLLPYPVEALQAATRDLAFAEFHDILPGSSVAGVEEGALRLMDHGLEELARVKAQAFFALASGQPAARPNTIPVLVYNPHPYVVETDVVCEFQLPDITIAETWTEPRVYHGTRQLPSQVEKEAGNLNADWRKRIVFRARLLPAQMNRFDCHLHVLPHKPAVPVTRPARHVVVRTAAYEVRINQHTGCIDRWRVRGNDVLAAPAGVPVVHADNEDPWGMSGRSLANDVCGAFAAMTPAQCATYCGVRVPALPPVRIIEDGPVRTMVEAVMQYNASTLCVRYILPKHGTEIGIHWRVNWHESNALLRMAIPTVLQAGTYAGQTAFGVQELPANNDECVAQKWVLLADRQQNMALTCINEGIYGSRCRAGVVALTLLRSPAYSGHPIGDRPVVPQDRCTPRIDQGVREFRVWLNAGQPAERRAAIEREALAHNEQPFALSFFPGGGGAMPAPFACLSDDVVQITAVKKAARDAALIVRLFEPTGHARTTVLTVPALKLRARIALRAFEAKTLKINPRTKRIIETNMLEEPCRK